MEERVGQDVEVLRGEASLVIPMLSMIGRPRYCICFPIWTIPVPQTPARQ